MAGKLKADPKQFLVNHGEKIGFAVVLGLVVLGLVGTNWVPYEREPSEITDRVAGAEQALASADWQQDEEERDKYQLDQSERPNNVVLAKLAGEIQLGRFRPSQRFNKPIVEVDRPLTEPDLLPVEQLIASAARVYIELPPEDATETESEEGDEDAEATEEEMEDEDLPDELRERRGAGAGSAVAGYGGGYDSSDYDYESMYAPELEMEEMYAGYEGYEEGEYDMYGSGYGGGATSNRRGKGYPFVSVRGVFPFKNQIYRYQDAIHRTISDAVREFEIIDFELQRQELAVGDPRGWDDLTENDWELVDINVLRDVILSASGIEPDVVSAAVTDAVITCPLPTRLTGVWDRQATHPRLRNFELSEAEIEREMEFNRALLKEFMDQQKDLPQTELTPRGFSDLIFDSRSLQAGLMGAESSYDTAMMTGMYGDESDYGDYGDYDSYDEEMTSGGFGGRQRSVATDASPELRDFARQLAEQFDDEDAAAEELQAWIVERATAEGELLLYRYLDFDVRPGYTYRYRVRLILKNPNYGQPITAAAGVEHVVQGETRPTPWSDPTEPVRVAQNVEYVLAGVEQNKVRPYPDAQMRIYQWDTDIGTVVHDELTIEVGQEIGGSSKVVQINAAKQTYKEDDYSFTSTDRLVDALRDLEFDRAAHPDLALPQGSLGEAHTVEYALVVQDGRALVALDPRTQSGDLSRLDRYVERQDELYSAWKRPEGGELDPEMAGGAYADVYSQLYGSDYDSGYGSSMGAYGGRRGRNSLRRGSR